MIHKDKPIERAEDDFLNRKDFSHRLANKIIEWKHKDSWVVALTGDWGIGKTSVKNLIVEKIQQAEPESVIIDFSPWEWSSQDLIVSAFFKEIATKLEINDESKKHEDLAEQLRTYLYYLNNITILTKPVVKTPSLIFGILILGSLYFEKEFSIELLTNFILIILASWLIIFEGLGGFLNSLAERREHLANKRNRSAIDLKISISKGLTKINQPIIIIIDDIDRLERDKILTVMQLIKSNADFNNVIFLLLYSKSILEKKITDHTQTGRDYMEKIVQVEFKVPEPDTIMLRKYLLAKLNLILNKLEYKNFDCIFDNEYFSDIFYHQGLFNYFTNLRSIYKFLNSFEFNLLSQFKNNYLEVNFTDFMVLEVFRIFEPKLYIGIFNNKTLMLGGIQDTNILIQISDEAKKDMANKFINDFSSINSINLLKTIFPKFSTYVEDTFDITSSQENIIKNRISHESRFDRYFIFDSSSNKLSTYEIINFFENLHNKNTTKYYLETIYEKDKFDSFLESSFSHLDKIPENLIVEYFNSLEFLYGIAKSFGIMSDKTKVSFLFCDSLKFFKYKQFDIINNILEKENISSLILGVYERIIEKEENYHLSEQDLEIIKTKINTIIEEFIVQKLNKFVIRKDRLRFLSFWYRYDKQNCVTIVRNTMEQSDKFFQIYSVFIIEAFSNHSTSVNLFIDKEMLSKFISLEDFEHLLITYNSNSININELEMKDLFFRPDI